jgi:hypothetical protein
MAGQGAGEDPRKVWEEGREASWVSTSRSLRSPNRIGRTFLGFSFQVGRPRPILQGPGEAAAGLLHHRNGPDFAQDLRWVLPVGVEALGWPAAAPARS